MRFKEVMYRIMYLQERYELKDGPPEHKSATSLVVFATDHGYDDISEREFIIRNVALKFMRHRDHFDNEV
jgi:hypothetical protein